MREQKNRVENRRGAALTEVLAITVAVVVAVGIVILKMHPPEKVTQGLPEGFAPTVVIGRGVGKGIAPKTAEVDEIIAFTKKSACRSNIQIINTAVELWHIEKERWPKEDLSDIAHDRNYFPNGIPRCPVNDTPYRLDPVLHRVVDHAHDDIPNPFEKRMELKKKRLKEKPEKRE